MVVEFSLGDNFKGPVLEKQYEASPPACNNVYSKFKKF